MLVGRTSERARIDRLLADTRNGCGGALIVRGAPGIGKSTLLFYGRSRAAGMQVLTASGVESEFELPFSALATLLRPLLSHLDELVPMQRAALERALALRRGGVPDRFGIGVATLSLLTLVADDRPVLTIVDDAQWVDAPSADALLFAARRSRGDPLAMLFAAREDERVSFEALGVSELRLGGLAPGECEALVRPLLGRFASRSLIDRLTRATGGNPLALVELPSLVSQERLEAGEARDDPVPVGPEISRAFSRRIATLPSTAQRALGLAAVSETGSMAEIGAVLRRLGSDPSSLAPAEVAGLVTIGAGKLEFRHPLLRAVAYHSLPAPNRRIAHLALAETLAGLSHQARRAWHLAAAVIETDEQTACELEMAAREAHSRAAPAAAAAALEAAACLTPNDDERVRRLIDAASEFHLAGRGKCALRTLDDALDRTRDPLVRGDIRHLRARVELLDAPCLETCVRLVAEAELVEALDPVRAAGMLIDASLVAVMAGEPRQALALAERAYPAAREVDGPMALAGAHALGAGLLLCGQANAAAPLLEAAAALTETDDLAAVGYLAVSVAHCHNWQDDHARGRDLLRRLIARARRESVLTVLPYALAALAEAEFHLGDWNAAYAAATESVSLAEEVGQRTELAHSLARLAHIEAGRGSETDCRELADRALELATRLQVGSIGTLVGTTLGFLELGSSRFREAIAHLEPIGRIAADVGLRESGVVTWAADLAEAYASVGENDKAHATLTSLEAQALQTRRVSALAAVSRVRGMLAPESEYVGHFTAALQWHERVPAPFDTARTRLCFGQRLGRDEQSDAARDLLGAALAAFEGVGASAWADQARSELQASGHHSPPETQPAFGLTPQELQVAMLVIDGASNREAAAALFISPKIVEVHLTRIYRKLGVRSRTQLARELRRST